MSNPSALANIIERARSSDGILHSLTLEFPDYSRIERELEGQKTPVACPGCGNAMGVKHSGMSCACGFALRFDRYFTTMDGKHKPFVASIVYTKDADPKKTGVPTWPEKREFTDQFRGGKESFPVGGIESVCQKCAKVMPTLASYTGPGCHWDWGGCGHTPETSQYKFLERSCEGTYSVTEMQDMPAPKKSA
jgi:hypothetical protein